MSITEKESIPEPNPTLLGTALTVAPAAVGCAVGLLLADRIKGKARSNLASTLLTIGAAATLPLAIDYVTKTIDSPSRARGSRKRLQSIRNSGVDAVDYEEGIVDGEELFNETA